jgi:hypothetical protein
VLGTTAVRGAADGKVAVIEPEALDDTCAGRGKRLEGLGRRPRKDLPLTTPGRRHRSVGVGRAPGDLVLALNQPAAAQPHDAEVVHASIIGSCAMADAFYRVDGDVFVSTDHTRGPWDENSQHAGPPAALLARAIELCEPREGMQVARITSEVLGPVPIEPLRVQSRVLRPGRTVELVEASLAGERGDVMRAQGWRLLRKTVELPAGLIPDTAPVGPQEASASGFFTHVGERPGWHAAMEFRSAKGGFMEMGPATMWMRPRIALVEGEELAPLQRVMLAADAGNGISATLDWNRFIFINTDISVHLHRHPEGEWVCLDSVTLPETSGIGMTDTTLYDERGPIGHALQTLVVRER